MKSHYYVPPWPAFAYGGQTYDLSHLDEFVMEAQDSAKAERHVIVSFGDHCFTRELEADDDPALRYPGSTRGPFGCFCPVRYRHSLTLPSMVREAASGWAWNLKSENFAVVPTVAGDGKPVLYAVVFSLDRVGKGLPADFHMRVRSAYPCDERGIVTYGKIRFAHLMTLRLQGKRPPRITEKNRKKPCLRP